MEVLEIIKNLDWLRQDIIGRNKLFETPLGQRPLVYADYTASGRNLFSIENYLMKIMQYYANTHTEDDFTGKTMTNLLHEAEKTIKKALNAGKEGKIIFTESGTTGGITRLQEILGVFWPPATKKRVFDFFKSCEERYPERKRCNLELRKYFNTHQSIVFVGPYEHHSNEIMWRQTLCKVVQIPLDKKGELDLKALENELIRHQTEDRLKIGSFSAASNVTGLKTPVYKVAELMHKYNGIACFDYAACGPYIEINMNKNSKSYFDAVYLSPHKFLGGPGTSGILVFNQKIYPADLPPTIAAGGTVDYVSKDGEEYIKDIETREKPGTPGILQAIKTALVFQLKEKVGLENIEKIEKFYYKRFKKAFQNNAKIEFYGIQDVDKKVPIIPFNIKHKDRILHPKFVTRLMNDLFGIQTRAGCSCAGPYGHTLMHIEKQISEYYRCMITNVGYKGIKPGWVRLNLHYALSEAEFQYLIDAIKFVIKYGHRFLPLYEFDIRTGAWTHLEETLKQPIRLDIEKAFQNSKLALQSNSDTTNYYNEALQAASEKAKSLPDEYEVIEFEEQLEKLIFFYVNKIKNYRKIEMRSI